MVAQTASPLQRRFRRGARRAFRCGRALCAFRGAPTPCVCRSSAPTPARAERPPEDPVAAGKALENRDPFLELHFSSPFWQVREWVGFETLCTLFYDDPAFLGEMIAFWSDHVARLLERALAVVKPDRVDQARDKEVLRQWVPARSSRRIARSQPTCFGKRSKSSNTARRGSSGRTPSVWSSA